MGSFCVKTFFLAGGVVKWVRFRVKSPINGLYALRALFMSGIALTGFACEFEMGSFCGKKFLQVNSSRLLEEHTRHDRPLPITRRTGILRGVGGVFAGGTFQKPPAGGFCAWCTPSCATWMQGQTRASAAHRQEPIGFWKAPGGGSPGGRSVF